MGLITRADLIAYCLRFPRTYEDYPFDSVSDPGAWTVMRHRGNTRSYALIYVREGRPRINLKADPAESVFLRQEFVDLTPAYHMNKVHWNTIILNGDVPWDEVTRQIAASYDLTRPKKEATMLKFDAVGLFVTDMGRMVAFYRDVMGMATEWDGEPYADLHADGFRLIMYGRTDFETMTSRHYSYPEGSNGTMELAFAVENYAAVDREYARVVAAGALPVMPPTNEPWGQRTSYVTDPDGNLVEIGSFQEI